MEHLYSKRVRVQAARLCKNLPHWTDNKKRGRKRQGLIYEKKVHEELELLYGSSYIPSLWLEYETLNDDYLHRCQPDGLLFDFHNGRIIVIEVKLKHTEQAYWQLRNLYLPVLGLLFPPNLWKLIPCEVVKWFDPSVAFPVPVIMCEDPLLAQGEAKFNACIISSFSSRIRNRAS